MLGLESDHLLGRTRYPADGAAGSSAQSRRSEARMLEITPWVPATYPLAMAFIGAAIFVATLVIALEHYNRP